MSYNQEPAKVQAALETARSEYASAAAALDPVAIDAANLYIENRRPGDRLRIAQARVDDLARLIPALENLLTRTTAVRAYADACEDAAGTQIPALVAEVELRRARVGALGQLDDPDKRDRLFGAVEKAQEALNQANARVQHGTARRAELERAHPWLVSHDNAA